MKSFYSLTIHVLLMPMSVLVTAPFVAKAAQERLIRGPRTVQPPLSANDRALRDAMQLDPSCTFVANEKLRQRKAIAAWTDFLKRKDLTREQEVFAWWRIGSLAAYNFNPTFGETADTALAERAFVKLREIAKDQISIETLNASTVYGALVGKPTDRARRLAIAYRWLFTRTDAMVQLSAPGINHNGSAINDRVISRGGMRIDTVPKKLSFLRSSLSKRREIMNRRITEEIQYSNNPKAIRTLLKTIRDIADAALMKKWNGMLSDVQTRSVNSRPDKPNAGRKQHGSSKSEFR